MRPVEGAMKLLRACFSSFPCIFCLAKHDDRYFSWNFNAALRYVPSMLWNISEISEIFWKVLWAGQTSGMGTLEVAVQYVAEMVYSLVATVSQFFL